MTQQFFNFLLAFTRVSKCIYVHVNIVQRLETEPWSVTFTTGSVLPETSRNVLYAKFVTLLSKTSFPRVGRYVLNAGVGGYLQYFVDILVLKLTLPVFGYNYHRPYTVMEGKSDLPNYGWEFRTSSVNHVHCLLPEVFKWSLKILKALTKTQYKFIPRP